MAKSKKKYKHKMRSPVVPSSAPRVANGAQPDSVAHTRKPQLSVRLSQCMIVKNEEKNIARALTWAKSIVYEQIVVDTGSTDKTVEIAESMGAKVYHYKWIGDFAAAKNYAIEQATGDWIAFLDADEYMSDEDAIKLMMILTRIETEPQYTIKKNTAMATPLVNLDDEGKPMTTITQQRFFRNVPEIRYAGAIHEYLTLNREYFSAAELTVIHTGYSASVYKETDKLTRNIEMLRKELSINPLDEGLQCYLADSLYTSGIEGHAEAYTIFTKALASNRPIPNMLKCIAYCRIIDYTFDKEDKRDECFSLCQAAYDEFPLCPDICYYLARRLFMKRDYFNAWNKYIECENLLKSDKTEYANITICNPLILFFQMVITADLLGNTKEVIRCATLALKEDKYQPGILTPYIMAFNKNGYSTPAEEILPLLEMIYDLKENTKDKITVLSGAKDAENMALASKILEKFTPVELEWLKAEI